MGPRSRFVETGDVRLHVVDWGGDGPPLLLVHATGFHARMWDPYAERLRGRFRVLALDQRGHGDSDQPRERFAWEQGAEDVAAVIRALDIAGCSAAGHSSGGTAVAVCAARYPGSIRRLVLIDPVVPDSRRTRPERPGTNPMAARTRRRRAVWDSPPAFAEAMGRHAAFARWRPEFLWLYAAHGLRRRSDGRYELKCTPELEAQVYEGTATYDPWPALDRLAVPALLLRATASQDGRAALSPEVPRRIPHCRDLPIAATHFIPMEEPEAVLAALEQFLDDGEIATERSGQR